jgi:hypothetical protein
MQLLLDAFSTDNKETTQYDNVDLDRLNVSLLQKKLTYKVRFKQMNSSLFICLKFFFLGNKSQFKNVHVSRI